MVVGVLCGREPLPLMEEPLNVKINSQLCIGNDLKPLLGVHLTKLDPGEINKIFTHDGKILCHT